MSWCAPRPSTRAGQDASPGRSFVHADRAVHRNREESNDGTHETKSALLLRTRRNLLPLCELQAVDCLCLPHSLPLQERESNRLHWRALDVTVRSGPWSRTPAGSVPMATGQPAKCRSSTSSADRVRGTDTADFDWSQAFGPWGRPADCRVGFRVRRASDAVGIRNATASGC